MNSEVDSDQYETFKFNLGAYDNVSEVKVGTPIKVNGKEVGSITAVKGPELTAKVQKGVGLGRGISMLQSIVTDFSLKPTTQSLSEQYKG